MRKHIGFLLVVLFVTFFGITTHTFARISDWKRGANMISKSQTDFGSDQTKQSIDALKATGANYISFIVPYVQSTTTSADIQRGSSTPTDEALTSAIKYAESIGLHTAIVIHAEVKNGTWRGYIDPKDRDAWYKAYGDVLVHYGTLGQANGVDDIVLGTELITVASDTVNPDNTAQWRTMIHRVRDVFKGQLSYGANWGYDNFFKEVSNIKFWDELDYIGISAYYPVYGATNDERKLSWQRWDNERIKPLIAEWNKPVVFTEIGYRSITNAHDAPWDWQTKQGYNGQEQADLYTALFSYWNNNDLGGVFLWQWETDSNPGGEGHVYFTPQHKPAEQVMKQWFNEPSKSEKEQESKKSASGDQMTFSVTGSDSTTPANQPVSVTINVKDTGIHVDNAVVDIEIYNKKHRIHQEAFSMQDFDANEVRAYSTTWTPSETGTYTVKVGVFSKRWSSVLLWENNASKITVTERDPNTPKAIDIWWPTDNASLTGTNIFKAVLKDHDISTYAMYWQVDDGELNVMDNSYQDYQHKEASADISGWNWNSKGPYKITFVAKDHYGIEIARTTLQINRE